MASEDDGSRTGLLLGVTWPLTTIVIVFLVGRFYCRLKYVNLWWDDWLALVSGVFLLASSISYTVYAALGGTKHYWSLTPEQLVTASRANWVSQPYSIVSLMTGKVSIGLLIARIQAPCKWRTWTLRISLAIMCLYDCVEIVLFYTICTPTWILWNPEAAPPWAHCLPSSVLIVNGQVVSSIMGFVDLLLAALAVQMIWTLQMPLRQKITICALLCTGVIAFIFAVLKVVAIPNDASGADLLWNNVELLIWGTVEPSVVTAAACVPTLLPLFQKIFGMKSASFQPKSSQVYSHEDELRSRKHTQGGSAGSGTEIMLAEHGVTNWTPESDWAAEAPRAPHPVHGGISVRQDFHLDEEYGMGAGGRGR